MPIQIRILPQVLHMMGKSEIFDIIHRSARLHGFIFFISYIGVIKFQHLGLYVIFKFSGKMCSLALHLVEMNLDTILYHV
jgi:hypothetical protein